MRNILQVVKSGKPTYPVRLASERLLKAATDAGEITDQEAGEFETTKKDEAIERIHRTINSLGRNLGPAQNARRELDAYYGGALAERYNPQGAFPYTVLVDAQGRVLKIWDGMPKSNTNTFIQEIRSASK